MKQNSKKSSKRVASEDRVYLDQTELHSNQEQDDWNEQIGKMTKTQVNLQADRISKAMRKLTS